MKKRGRGVGVMWYPVGAALPVPSSAFVKINPDGTLVVLAGAKDVGQGSTTALAQVAADALGVPLEWVSMVTADTDLTPFDAGSTGSRVTYVAARAIEMAIAQAKQLLLEVASERLGVAAEEIESGQGKMWAGGNPERSIGVTEVAGLCYSKKTRAPVGAASYSAPVGPPDPETGQGKVFPSYVYATQIAEVEVDTETGDVQVLRLVAAHDSGRVVNPLLAEGQIYSGIAQGIGQALTEEMLVREGRTLNPDFQDYIIPTALDIPDIQIFHCETPDPTSAFGIKAVGEASIVPTAPAVINAIYDAVGVRIYNLPATPAKILRGLKEAAGCR